MSVAPSSSVTQNHVRPAPTAASSQSAAAAALQEATESAATTRLEAAHGDQVAMRKLASQQQQAKPAVSPAPAAQTRTSAPGRVDIEA
jgi:hypothetical protein